MHYYEHHIGDYAAATAHLTLVEDAVYSRLLRRYYMQEEPLPSDELKVARLVGARTQEEVDAVRVVLDEFFVLLADGWHNKRADEEIVRYRAKLESARENGKKGGRPAKQAAPETEQKPKKTQPFNSGSENKTQPKAHQAPYTINQEEQKQEHVPPAAARPRFDEFWAAYPNRKAKKDARKVWDRQRLDARCDELIAHVALMLANDDGWRRGFVPMASTYLNGERWDDVPTVAMARAGPNGQQPMGKTAQALMALDDFGGGSGLDQAGNFGGVEAAGLLGPGTDPGGGGVAADRRRLVGGAN